MRLMLTLEEKRKLFLITPQDGQKLDFRSFFANDHPLHIEIGSGRGEFLLKSSQQNPGVNYVGIELKEKRISTILKQINTIDHQNIRLMKAYVDSELLSHVPENSINRIYIFHPDPWPKRKHHKNRLIQPVFIENLLPILSPEGSVVISTDFKDYASEIVKVFSQNSGYKSVYEEGFSREPEPGHIVTYFEIKLRKEGFDPYFMRFNKAV